jgi:hypothetical protein
MSRLARSTLVVLSLSASAAALPQEVPPAPWENPLIAPIQPDDLTPGYVLIEGDIQVPQYEYDEFLYGNPDSAFGTVNYWTTLVVPYDFVTSGSGAVSASRQTSAVNAMAAISSIAGVVFRPAVANDPDRIRFQASSYNNSPIGRKGGIQIINIAGWGSKFLIVHEIYHSLGFWHEQSRPDRDLYVTINPNNVCGSGISNPCTSGTGSGQCCQCRDNFGNCTPCISNFNIRVGALWYGTYDFDSLMHYPGNAFSCNGLNTLTVNLPWRSVWQTQIGQLDHFSYFDAVTCRGLYPFPKDRWLDATWLGTKSGTFLAPFNSGFTNAATATPSGGTLLINPGSYPAVGTYTTAIELRAPLGGVDLQ